jgi:hypothetical protein
LRFYKLDNPQEFSTEKSKKPGAYYIRCFFRSRKTPWTTVIFQTKRVSVKQGSKVSTIGGQDVRRGKIGVAGY